VPTTSQLPVAGAGGAVDSGLDAGGVAVSVLTDVDGDAVALSDADKPQPCTAIRMVRVSRRAPAVDA
jgi:uncharacterized Rossmann fold enzyme